MRFILLRMCGGLSQAHKEDGFRWWVQRLSRCFQLHDEVRIDHFRGFAGARAHPRALVLPGRRLLPLCRHALVAAAAAMM